MKPALARAVVLVQAWLSLPFWLLGTSLCAIAAAVHPDHRFVFDRTSELFDPERYRWKRPER